MRHNYFLRIASLCRFREFRFENSYACSRSFEENRESLRHGEQFYNRQNDLSYPPLPSSRILENRAGLPPHGNQPSFYSNQSSSQESQRTSQDSHNQSGLEEITSLSNQEMLKKMISHWIPEETLRKDAQAAVKDIRNPDFVQMIVKMVEQVGF